MKKSIVIAAIAAAACARPQPTIAPPGVTGDFPPRSSDSIMTSGPYPGAVARLVCRHGFPAPEVGDFVSCWVTTTIIGERGITEIVLPDSIVTHTTSPNVLVPMTRGELVARNPGATTVWTTIHGAVAARGISVTRKVGMLRFEPNVPDTAIRVGDTLRFRAIVLDDTGRALPVGRVLNLNVTNWGNPGRAEPLDSAQWRFVARAPGRIEFWTTFGRRVARMNVRVDTALTPPPPPRRSIVRVLATRGPSTGAARVGVRLEPEGSVTFSDTTGFVRYVALAPGTRVIHATCPVSRRLIGREFAQRSIDVTTATDTLIHLTLAAGECIEPPEQTVRGTFEGHYTSGFEDESFRPCRDFPIQRGDAYDQQNQVAWVAFDSVAARDPRLRAILKESEPGERLFVRWSGILTGPGSYGHLGTAEYLLRVEKILEIRKAGATACAAERRGR